MLKLSNLCVCMYLLLFFPLHTDVRDSEVGKHPFQIIVQVSPVWPAGHGVTIVVMSRRPRLSQHSFVASVTVERHVMSTNSHVNNWKWSIKGFHNKAAVQITAWQRNKNILLTELLLNLLKPSLKLNISALEKFISWTVFPDGFSFSLFRNCLLLK